MFFYPPFPRPRDRWNDCGGNEISMDERNRYVAMIVLQSVIYGAMDVISKLAYQSISVYSFLLLRYLLAAAVMLLIWGRPILRELRTVSPGRYLVPGLCMSGALLLSNLALSYTRATNVSFIRSLSAILVPVLLLVFFRQRYERHDAALQLLVVLGLYLLCMRGGGTTGIGAGELLSFLAALLMAGSLVFGKRALGAISAVGLSFVQTFLSILLCGVMCLLTGAMPDLSCLSDGRIVLSLVYAAVACTIGGYLLQNIALEHISSKIVGMVQCLYPVATAVLAFLILRERLTPLGLLGAAAIFVAVLLESKWNDRT